MEYEIPERPNKKDIDDAFDCIENGFCEDPGRCDTVSYHPRVMVVAFRQLAEKAIAMAKESK